MSNLEAFLIHARSQVKAHLGKFILADQARRLLRRSSLPRQENKTLVISSTIETPRSSKQLWSLLKSFGGLLEKPASLGFWSKHLSQWAMLLKLLIHLDSCRTRCSGKDWTLICFSHCLLLCTNDGPCMWLHVLEGLDWICVPTAWISGRPSWLSECSLAALPKKRFWSRDSQDRRQPRPRDEFELPAKSRLTTKGATKPWKKPYATLASVCRLRFLQTPAASSCSIRAAPSIEPTFSPRATWRICILSRAPPKLKRLSTLLALKTVHWHV